MSAPLRSTGIVPVNRSHSDSLRIYYARPLQDFFERFFKDLQCLSGATQSVIIYAPHTIFIRAAPMSFYTASFITILHSGLTPPCSFPRTAHGNTCHASTRPSYCTYPFTGSAAHSRLAMFAPIPLYIHFSSAKVHLLPFVVILAVAGAWLRSRLCLTIPLLMQASHAKPFSEIALRTTYFQAHPANSARSFIPSTVFQSFRTNRRASVSPMEETNV
jgi:hypothetical protein